MHFKIAFNVLCFVKLSNWINLLPWWTENSKDPKSGFLGYSHSKLALEYGESCGDFSFCCCLFVCGNDVLVWFSLLLYFLLYQSIIYSKNTSSTLLAKLAMSNCSDGSKEWPPCCVHRWHRQLLSWGELSGRVHTIAPGLQQAGMIFSWLYSHCLTWSQNSPLDQEDTASNLGVTTCVPKVSFGHLSSIHQLEDPNEREKEKKKKKQMHLLKPH